MTESLIDAISPVLERVGAEDIHVINRDEIEEVKATIYEQAYTFKFAENGGIVAQRGDGKTTYFAIEEIECLEHINMPLLSFVRSNTDHYSLPEQRASDIALRLHLIMEGDVYTSEELVTFINAGTQRSCNYYHARG